MAAIEKQLDSIIWCKDPWLQAPVSEEARRLLAGCRDATPPEPSELQHLIDNSNRFPVPFPVQTVRLEKLKVNTPVERLKRNASSTYPLIHERVLVLMANFILYKRKYGSTIEMALYRDMSIPQLIDRILQKRAITFMKAQDQYKLITGETGTGGWESVGTDSEKPPLVLSNCLSYDEMKISALVCVSGYTECINDGTRRNAAVPRDDGVEREAVIIGLIGPRFKRVNRMEYEDIVVTKQQNTRENGYGYGYGCDTHEDSHNTARRMWRHLWADFYQIPSIVHSELERGTIVACTASRVFSERWARVGVGVGGAGVGGAGVGGAGVGGAGVGVAAFDNTNYCRRLTLVLDVAILDADHRAMDAGKVAFLNIIGAGLGVWKFSRHQVDIFVLATLSRARALLAAGHVRHVAVINLAYITPGKHVMALFKTSRQNSGDEGEEAPKVLFLNNDAHPRGGIKIQLQSRQPSSKLTGEHEGMLLVLTYPWDGNAHPGNEFWIGKLTSSGDPACACSTQVAELHNAHVAPAALCGDNTRVVDDDARVRTLHEHCRNTFQE